jgi:endonuclease YncB( thermonuclease family)
VVTVDGRDLGLEMVRAGFAWSYPRQTSLQSAQEANDYQQAEFNARIRRLGLWNSKNPVPPWVWRVQRRH